MSIYILCLYSLSLAHTHTHPFFVFRYTESLPRFFTIMLSTAFIVVINACFWSKCPWHRSYGLFQPLPTLDGLWKSISLDFITDLQTSSKSFDVKLTIVDRFTKMTKFLPCLKTIYIQTIVDLLMHELFHGLLDDIIRDIGPQFISRNTCLDSSKLIVNSLRVITRDWWSKWTSQPNLRTMYSLFHQLQTRLLGWLFAFCAVFLE